MIVCKKCFRSYDGMQKICFTVPTTSARGCKITRAWDSARTMFFYPHHLWEQEVQTTSFIKYGVKSVPTTSGHHQHSYLHKPVAVAKWRARLLTVREVSRLNPGNLPLLQMWHVGNMTGCHAVYTLIQCTPLLVEKAGVTPDVTFRITACKQERVQARYPLWIWNPWGRTHKVQNRSNQWLHKMDLGPDKKIKKKKNHSIYIHRMGNGIRKFLSPYSNFEAKFRTNY